MANNADTQKRQWALLIGINFYLNDKPLMGCTRDVQTFEQYLQKETRPNGIEIVTLTATASSDPRSPQESRDRLPTYENVTNSLTGILRSSKSGDSVYVHYSGHGTRNPLTGALALVLFDHEKGSRLLYGQLLATLLEKMTEKGVFIMLVLDCCFSGSSLRYGDYGRASARVTDYDPAIDAAYPTEGSEMTSNGEVWLSRDAYALPQWLISPNYTIFTACSPHETATELETESLGSKTKERRGALSYFLLEALISLRKTGVEVSNSSLYQHLLTKFHIYWPRQTPMRRGNQRLSFFGRLQLEPAWLFVPVFRTDDGRICLDAGHAHDVREGDEYALYPFNTSERMLDQAKIPGVRFRVDDVGCLTSNLVTIESNYATRMVEDGWKARLLTRFPAWTLPVRLNSDIENRSQWIASARTRVSLRLYTEIKDIELCLFSVICNAFDEYDICDASDKRVAGFPSVPKDQDNAVEHVIDILEHMAEFKRFEGIQNRVPDTTFERSFRIITSDREKSAADNNYINHKSKWQFSVENLSDKPLYLTLFNLGQSGQIKNLMSEAAIDFLVVEPKGEQTGSMTMEVPETLISQGHRHCEDIMKFFITARATYFPAEILPTIPQTANALDESGRSGHGSRSIAKFLSLLESQMRGREDDAWINHWATKNCLVRTVAE